MNSYKEYMYRLSHSDLQNYLGSNILDLLVEWTSDKEILLTKKDLVELIDSVYGPAIFENRNLRENLLLSMDAKDIIDIRDNVLKGREKSVNDLTKLVEIISSKPWKDNKITSYLMNLWCIPENVFDKKKDENELENIISSSSEQFYELLDYQFYIKQRVLNILTSETVLERMLIHMPTGTGKTKTTMHIITNYINFNLKKKGIVIWVAHTTELLQQAYETFLSVWSHLGDGEITAYKLWGNRTIEDVDKELNGVVFCGLAKLMSIAERNPKLYERLNKDCRLIVFDEAHKAAATKTRKIIEGFMKIPKGYEDRSLIGLTATPGRTTDDSYDNNLLTNMFGNKLIYIDSNIINQINLGPLQALNTVAEKNIIKYFQERHILAKMSVKKLTYKTIFTEKEKEILKSKLQSLGFDEKEFTKEQINVFATNKERNLEIMKQLRQLYIDKKPTIVFACSVEHAKMLSAMLTIEEIPNRLILGEMDPIDREEAIETFKNKNSGVDIIINYEVLTTGFDAKNIKCVFITRPTKSIVLYSQMLGRGLRGPMMGGNEECLLVDIEDNLLSFDNETAFSHFNDYWKVD